MSWRSFTTLGVLLLAGCPAPKSLDSGAAMDCSKCHGGPENAAPPRALGGETSAADPAVGAHQAHLRDSAIAKALSCGECHPVPAELESPPHLDDRVDVVFGPTASANGLAPRYDTDTHACASVWCHGAKLTGGAATGPTWTGTAGSGCGDCHGVPPPAPHDPGADCHACHPGTVRTDGTIDVAGGLHLDGKLESLPYHPEGWEEPGGHGAEAKADLPGCSPCHSGSGDDLAGGFSGVGCDSCHPGWRKDCTFCHGVAGNPSGAPPVDTHGRSATTEITVGAHTAHLTASTIAGPVACGECHLLPGEPIALSHASEPKGTVTFGPIATAKGTAATWAAPTCTSYCHGATLTGGSNVAPDWTKVDGTQAACGSCHANPPTMPPHAPTSKCSACHPGTMKPDGSLDVAGGKHVNGVLEAVDLHPDGWETAHGAEANQGLAACTSCHGDDFAGGSSGSSCNDCHRAALEKAGASNTDWKTNCTFCHGGTQDQTGAPPEDVAGNAASVKVGAHAVHVKASETHVAFGCAECHPPRTDILTAKHLDGTVQIEFGTLARAKGASPAWTPGTGGKAGTCSGVYCHGASYPGFGYTNMGGTPKAPSWSGPATTCTSCHGMPPPAPHSTMVFCDGCHSSVQTGSGKTLIPAKHIDGLFQCSGGMGAPKPGCDEP